MKIVITGAAGLLGWHTAGRLHAQNCGARFGGRPEPYDLVLVDRSVFDDAALLVQAVAGADGIIHFAGVNRGEEKYVEAANPAISQRLIEACRSAGSSPHVVYANSTHSRLDTFYGRSKRIAGGLLAEAFPRYTSLVLPHIFGECARPYYNNVTATLIDQLWKSETPQLNPEGRVELLHAGSAATIAIDAILNGVTGEISPAGRTMTIVELYDRLKTYHESYQTDIFPDFADEFDLALFNSYRTGGYPAHYPKPMAPKSDHRGTLFETAKGLGASQSFISTTLPGKVRGDHFHTDLVERFLVVSGRATIRIRKVLTDEVHAFEVDGDNPVAIDMPPLHTHHIENSSQQDVTTFFWAHRLFDPGNPDTFADPVLKEAVSV